MIVKNEAEEIADCLASFEGVADEICVVDTGSTDETLRILESAGVKVGHFPWCNDFSAARNASLELCSCDWVLVVDADERIALGDHAKLRELAQGPMELCYRFATRNYTNSATTAESVKCRQDEPLAHGAYAWFPSTKVRMFPRLPAARFTGRVHELINDSLEANGIRVVDTDVPIHHYSFERDAGRLREKQEMYVRLGLAKIAEFGDDPKAYSELADQYAELGDYANAAANYRESLSLEASNHVALKDLGGMLHLLGRNAEAEKLLVLSAKLEPTAQETWQNLGVVCVSLEKWPQAIEAFERAIQLDGTWDDGHRYLSVALQGAGRLEEAVKASQRAVKLGSNPDETIALYVQQMTKLGRAAEAEKFIERLA